MICVHTKLGRHCCDQLCCTSKYCVWQRAAFVIQKTPKSKWCRKIFIFHDSDCTLHSSSVECSHAYCDYNYLLLFLDSVGDISEESRVASHEWCHQIQRQQATSYEVHMSHHLQHWVLTCIMLQSLLTPDLLTSLSLVIPQRIFMYHFEVSFPTRN